MPGRGGEAYHYQATLSDGPVFDSRKPKKIWVRARIVFNLYSILMQTKIYYSLIKISCESIDLDIIQI